MGIETITNFVLALRHHDECRIGRRGADECIPERLLSGQSYDFRKKGQRLFLMTEEIPLVETFGNEHISRPLASIRMAEVTHFVENHEVWTRGRYLVVEVFKDDAVHFDGMIRIRC